MLDLEAFDRRLNHERSRLRALNSYVDAVEAHDGGLAVRLRPVVEHRVSLCQDLLDACEHDTDTRWADLDEARRQIDDVTERTQPLLAGALARALGLDAGQCAQADALLDELAGLGPGPPVWRALTVPATNEQFDLADGCIRVGWGSTDLASAAVAVHELGHAAMSQVSRLTLINGRRTIENPARARSETIAEGFDVRASHLAEHWADAYAVYLAGPAPLAAMVEMIFPPADANQATPSHPSPARRLAVMLAVLADVDGSEQGVAARRWIVARWEALVADAGGKCETVDAESVAPIVTDCLSDLHTCLPGAVYKGLPRAYSLAARLLEGAASITPGDRLVEVVNAAWIARLDPQCSVKADEVARATAAMAKAVSDRG